MSVAHVTLVTARQSHREGERCERSHKEAVSHDVIVELAYSTKMSEQSNESRHEQRCLLSQTSDSSTRALERRLKKLVSVYSALNVTGEWESVHEAMKKVTMRTARAVG